jgi:hypothetical protein
VGKVETALTALGLSEVVEVVVFGEGGKEGDLPLVPAPYLLT